jgi:hypothetical protein
MPMSYKIASSASSLTDLFMPHVYVVNLVLLAALAYPICHLLAGHGRIRAGVAGGVGLFGIFCASVSFIWLLAIGALIPVVSIAGVSIAQYHELRPVAVIFNSMGNLDQCKASYFWFSNRWQYP